MEETQTVAILSALAQGVNPLTGEVLASDSPFQHADVVRALHAAVERFQELEPQHGAAKRRARADAPPNVGKPWSEAEDQRLLAEFDRGREPGELARELGRTLAGIEARLERHGRLKAGERKTSNRYPRERLASPSKAAD